MNLQQLKTAYGLVAGKNTLPNMEFGRLSITRCRYHSSDEVLTRMVKFSPKHAWVTFQSANIVIVKGDLQASYPDEYGCLLAAECVSVDGKLSLHVRYDGDGENPWLVSVYEQRDGEEYLYDTIGLVATTSKLGKLQYRRYWHIDAVQGAEPCFACFTGFTENH